MNKPRILFITPLPPPVHGSAMVSQYIKDSNLIQSSFETDFVNLSTSRCMNEIGKRNWKKPFRYIGTICQVFYKLLVRRYDLCYLAITCHGIGFLKDAPFVLLCKQFGRKIVLHQHNKGMSKEVNRFPYKWLFPMVYKHVQVILLSWRLYTDVEQVVGKEQVWVCPNGIPVSLDVSTFLKADVAIPQMLFLSNLVESKGVYVLLDACRLLREAGYRFVCHVVGGESKEIDKHSFEEEINKRGLTGMVIYCGPQYGKKKEAFFREADLFVQPTYEDCFPLTIVEAMQYGLPVVTTDEGAIPDMVIDGENGYVCERKNPLQLAKKLEKLLVDSELRKQMGRNGCLRYKERYTLEAFESKLRDILSDILN